MNTNSFSMLPLGQSELHVIVMVLQGYVEGLHRHSTLPHINALLQRVQPISTRLHTILQTGGFTEGSTFFLVAEEAYLIIEAMHIFTTSLRKIVPPSPERDATLSEVDQLRQRLSQAYPPPVN